MIPEGWKKKRVADLCETVSVGIVVKPTQYYTSAGNGIKAFRSANVREGKIDDSKWIYISKDGHLSNPKSRLQTGDVLVVRSGAPGTSCVVSSEYNDTNCIDLVFARPRKTEVLPEYLATFTNSDLGKRQVASMEGGLALKHFNVSAYKQMEVYIPPISEQQNICDLLITWQNAIEKTERLIEAKEKWHDWFRQRYISGNKRIVSGGLKWKTVQLHEVLNEHGEVSSGAEEVCSVSLHKGVINQVEHLGRVFAANNTSNYNLVKHGDIIYTKSPTGDFPYGIVKQSRLSRHVIVSPLYGVFTPITFELGVILDFYFESEVSTRNYLRPLIQKGAKNTMNITNNTFLSGALHLPMDPSEQKRIVEIIITARRQMGLLKQQAELYRKQKRGLMQKLLTGEWRVKTAGEVL